jgi:hypothetical protein
MYKNILKYYTIVLGTKTDLNKKTKFLLIMGVINGPDTKKLIFT